jgi:hypothetical protein
MVGLKEALMGLYIYSDCPAHAITIIIVPCQALMNEALVRMIGPS